MPLLKLASIKGALLMLVQVMLWCALTRVPKLLDLPVMSDMCAKGIPGLRGRNLTNLASVQPFCPPASLN